MLNIIRADLYRILRGKGFYITIILLIGFIILQALTQGSVQIAMVTEDGEIAVEPSTAHLDFTDDEVIGYGVRISGGGDGISYFSYSGDENLENTDLNLYFLWAFILFIACTDFSTDAVKNVLSNGMSRVKYYFAKLILCCIFCVAVVILHVAVSIITVLVTIEIAKIFTDNFAAEVNIQAVSLIKAVLAQIFMCISVTCVGVFFVFAIRRTAGAQISYIAFCFAPLVIIYILFQINNDLKFLFNYEVISNIRLLRMIALDAIEAADIIRAFAIGGFYILASTIGGLLIFKRSEIK